jgi:hypothetical protein
VVLSLSKLLLLAAFSLMVIGGDVPPAHSQPGAALADDSDRALPLYAPPKKLSPRARVGGRLRGTEGPDPEVQAIVPDHVGFTVQQTPTLNWFLSKPTSDKVTFTLTNTESIKPLYEGTLPSPRQEGFQAIDLKVLGLTLEPDVQYRWHVAVERDPDSHSKDIVAGGIIERCEFTACLMIRPNLSCNQESVAHNMRAGFWYDAMGCLCKLIDGDPQDSSLRRLRAHLLKQVGLHGVAEWDLSALQRSIR